MDSDLARYESSFRRHSCSLSGPAHVRLKKLASRLASDPGWLHGTSRSVLIEFLIWFHETNGEAPIGQFSPDTAPRGRPRATMLNSNFQSVNSVRPSEVRAEIRRQEALDRARRRARLSE